MANTPLEFHTPHAGETGLTAKVFADDSDTVLETILTLTDETNRPSVFRGDLTGAHTGLLVAHIFDSGGNWASGPYYFIGVADDTTRVIGQESPHQRFQVQGILGTDLVESTTGRIAANFDNFYDNGDAITTKVVDDVGGAITDIINPIYEIPSPDIQGTLTTRIAIQLTNALDDLPSTAEITPGTIKIETRNPSATSWTTVRNDVAMSENAGKIYYDETFSSSNGYAEGDQLRFTFKSQKVTVSANDYEINDATGTIKQSRVNLDNTAKNKFGLISTDRTVTLPLVSNDDIIRINRNRDFTATIGNSPFIFAQDGTTQDFTGFSTFKMQLTKQADALSGDSTIEITDADLTGAGTSSQQVTFNIAAADTATAALTDTTNLNAASLSTNYYAYTFEAIVCSGSGQEIVIGTGWIDMRDSQASSC